MAREIADRTRRAVVERAGGRCEYCLLSSRFWWFSAPDRSHRQPQTWRNIPSRKSGVYACVLCNRYKGSDVAAIDPLGQVVRLFDPRRDRWEEHFKVEGSTIQPLTEIGEATARLLRLNAAERVIERRLQQHVGLYPRK